jgi:hypothetical protein
MSKPKNTTTEVTPKSNADLAEVTATLQCGASESLYKESAQFIGPIAKRMRGAGEEYAQLRLTLGFYLAWIAQREKGALTRFVKMAAKGQLEAAGFPAMAERTLYNAQAFFKTAAKACGLPLSDVPALRDSMAAEGQTGALDLFGPGAGSAGEVGAKLRDWLRTSGVRAIDEQMADAAAAEKFAGGGGGGDDEGHGDASFGGDGKGGQSDLTDEEIGLRDAVAGIEKMRQLMLRSEKTWHHLPVSECPHECADRAHCNHTLVTFADLLRDFGELVAAKIAADSRKRKRA